MGAPSSSTTTYSTATSAVAVAASTLAAWGVYTYLTYDPRWWWTKRAKSPKEVKNQPDWKKELIHGTVSQGWEPVYDEFVANFDRRGELGASVCVCYKGEKVVDLWGGYRDREAQLPWTSDTLCPTFSIIKGISAFALLLQESRGKLDFDEKVSKYWPEFAQHDKQDVTISQLINHTAGVAGIDPPVTLAMLQEDANHRTKTVRNHIAEAQMEWPNPGDYKGYMAIILGFYESALVELTDDQERTIGSYLRDEVFVPLGIQEEIYTSVSSDNKCKIAKLDAMTGIEPLWPKSTGFPVEFFRNILLRPKSYTARALRNPQLSNMPSCMDYDRQDVQACEIPAANGLATARAIAKVFLAAERAIYLSRSPHGKGLEDNVAFMLSEDNPLGLSKKALDRCLSPPQPGICNGWIDEVLGIECCFGEGFVKASSTDEIGLMNSHTTRYRRFWSVPNGFGSPGASGSLGYCDPDAQIAYAYIPNRCGQCFEDPRDICLRTKMYQVVEKLRSEAGEPPLPKSLAGLTAPHYLTQRYMEGHPELAPLP